MIFYDFEVFRYDWLVVLIDLNARKETVIINDPDKLKRFYEEHKGVIWAGYNSRNYDQYILKAILCGFDPKPVNDWIIAEDKPGYRYSSLFREYPLINYDVMPNPPISLKALEAFMGHSIKETSVPFDIDRPLTEAELAETVKYCRHDVEQTVEVWLRRKEDEFDAQMSLVKAFHLPISDIGRTKAQLSAKILGAVQREHNDEFEIEFPPSLRIEKYTEVLNWYKNPLNRDYSKTLELDVAGVPHVFAWGGLHGAIPKYHGEGWFVNVDVASYYTHTAFEVQKGVGLGWDITGLDQKKLETLLSKPWTTDGRTFRDRCWLNKNDLVGSVSKSLTQGLLRGDSPAKITTAIQKQFGVHRYKAGRLVNTETTYFNAVATKECYKDLDVEMVEIIETLDSHTCSICGGLDGTVIPISQYEPGVTVPPFHPNCRGTTAPAIDPKYAGERAARNADGDVYYIPANMKYADWVQTFVNNGSKAGLTVATGAAIIKAKRALETLKPEMFPEYLTDKKELKNTKTLMEYVNGCENADPDVVALYAKMGDMENIRANGISMKVSHGKNHAVNYRYYTRNDQLAEAELIIPKLAGDDLTGQVVTTLHEEMHLMDMFNRADPAKYSGWFSSSNAKLSAFFQKNNTDIADDIDALFEAFDKECERIAAEINAELRTATSALNDQYYARAISYANYKKEFNRLKREASEQIDYRWAMDSKTGV